MDEQTTALLNEDEELMVPLPHSIRKRAEHRFEARGNYYIFNNLH